MLQPVTIDRPHSGVRVAPVPSRVLAVRSLALVRVPGRVRVLVAVVVIAPDLAPSPPSARSHSTLPRSTSADSTDRSLAPTSRRRSGKCVYAQLD